MSNQADFRVPAQYHDNYLTNSRVFLDASCLAKKEQIIKWQSGFISLPSSVSVCIFVPSKRWHHISQGRSLPLLLGWVVSHTSKKTWVACLSAPWVCGTPVPRRLWGLPAGICLDEAWTCGGQIECEARSPWPRPEVVSPATKWKLLTSLGEKNAKYKW